MSALHAGEPARGPASARLKARLAGGLYVVTIAAGMFALSVRAQLTVRGDAAATARHILDSQAIYRAAMAADILGIVAYVGVTAILYELLAPVSRTLSLTAAALSLVGCAVGAAILALVAAPLLLLAGQASLPAFSPAELQTMALTSLRLHDRGYDFGMVFFGFYCLLLGYLTFRSGFFPRWLGLLLALTGTAWLAGSLGDVLAPALSARMNPYVDLAGLLGEGALTLWLLAVGLDGGRWAELAGTAPGRSAVELRRPL